MNRQEKIDKIYSVIADKTLSFGCKIVCGAIIKNKLDCFYYDIFIHKGMGINSYFKDEKEKVEFNGNYLDKIIGHPVMIGDVMDYFSKNNFHFAIGNGGKMIGNKNKAGSYFELIWNDFLKPIEAQSDECVDFVYDLIFK